MIAIVSRVWCIGSKRSSAARVYHIPDVNRPGPPGAGEGCEIDLISVLWLRLATTTTHVEPSGSTRVHHPHQGQALSGGCGAGRLAVAGLADGPEPRGVARSAADHDRAAHDVARHVMQVAVGRQPQREPLLAPDPVQRTHDAVRSRISAASASTTR